jgi:hypothetical protein
VLLEAEALGEGDRVLRDPLVVAAREAVPRVDALREGLERLHEVAVPGRLDAVPLTVRPGPVERPVDELRLLG